MMHWLRRFLLLAILLFATGFLLLYMAMGLAQAEMTESISQVLMGSENIGEGPFIFPVSGDYVITSGFGERDIGLAGASTYHEGIDISTPDGKSIPVFAAGDGTAEATGYTSRAGNYVILNHGNGITTVYMHLAEETVFVKRGDFIGQGQVLGFMGDTGVSSGVHLHFEVRISGNPVNPLIFLSQAKGEETYADE